MNKKVEFEGFVWDHYSPSGHHNERWYAYPKFNSKFAQGFNLYIHKNEEKFDCFLDYHGGYFVYHTGNTEVGEQCSSLEDAMRECIKMHNAALLVIKFNLERAAREVVEEQRRLAKLLVEG